MNFFDAHFHLIPSVESCGKDKVLEFYKGENLAITCAHSPKEFLLQDSFIRENGLETKIVQSFGIHPQLPLVSNATFLEQLLKEKKIRLIGEAGYDFFTEEFRTKAEEQREAFHICLDFAVSYNVPIVIHNRKALDEMFREIKILKKLPFVLFHSFAFSDIEAKSILSHGVNGFFSFSKQILNGNKKSISCVEKLPLERVFMETDAPYQTLKGEEWTYPSEIENVYKCGAEIKKMSLETFCKEIRDNFNKIFTNL